LEPHGPVQAALAERRAALALVRDDGSALLDARQAAWRAAPTLERLLTLVDVATALDRREEVVTAEADRSGADPLAQAPALAASVLLLDGRVDEAIDLLESADLHGGHGRHPGLVVAPFLLVGASDAASDQRWKQLLLFDLLAGADTADWPYHGRNVDDDFDAFRETLGLTGDVPARLGSLPRDDLSLSALLLDALDQHPSDLDERRKWLDAARAHVDARVDAVVGGQHRGAYRQVAQLAAACAEAVALADGDRASAEFIDSLHARWPRHSAFRRELRPAVAQSPLRNSGETEWQ
ncbi:MAG: hypothetical protein ACRDYA_24735, partial [Egibacteraceae bacterium]